MKNYTLQDALTILDNMNYPQPPTPTDTLNAMVEEFGIDTTAKWVITLPTYQDFRQYFFGVGRRDLLNVIAPRLDIARRQLKAFGINPTEKSVWERTKELTERNLL